jgi:GT2 family glycosyltransferase
MPGMAEREKVEAANLTVAISTRDRSEALGRCLDTLLSGEILPAEIIVVDQSCNSRTKLAVEQRRSQARSLVYIQDEGRGLGRAQNLAIRHSRYPIIAVTDDDCVPAQDWIARILKVLEPAGQIDAVTGRILPLGPEVPGSYAVASRTSTVRMEFDRIAMPWEVGSGNNFAVKRVWLDRIDGNDERLGPGTPGKGAVDMDLFYRLLRAGARIRYEPDLLVYHARTSKAGRLARRLPYGYGIGACCSLWLREKDYHALRVLGRWLLMRARRMAAGLWRQHWMLAQEEALVLFGTFGGLLHGFRAPEGP